MFLLWLLMGTGLGPARAQPLALRDYPVANGLPQTMVYASCQDGRGQLWAGTQSGVCAFNGQQFRTYDGRQGLPDNHVRAVAFSPTGTLWLGHQYGGVSGLCEGREGRYRACACRPTFAACTRAPVG